jgi:hypothetical protein
MDPAASQGARQLRIAALLAMGGNGNGPEQPNEINLSGSLAVMRRAMLHPELRSLQTDRATPNLEGPGPGSGVEAASCRASPTQARRGRFQLSQRSRMALLPNSMSIGLMFLTALKQSFVFYREWTPVRNWNFLFFFSLTRCRWRQSAVVNWPVVVL